jgi:hypothetical protein
MTSYSSWRTIAVVLLIACSLFAVPAQAHTRITAPFFGEQAFVAGYSKTLFGETIGYFSIYPEYVKTALLTRCTNGAKTIEWETAPVAANHQGPYIYFSWIAAHSTGTSSGTRHFDLYINDHMALTFTTNPKSYPPYWTFGTADSTRLVFEYMKQDGAKDAHGVAYLRVPVVRTTPGKPLRLKVVGQNQQSNDWYMTFQYAYEEKADVEAMPFLLRSGSSARKQPLQVSVLHFGKPVNLQVNINGKTEPSREIQHGLNMLEYAVDAVKTPTNVQVLLQAGNLRTEKQISVQPVIHREVYLLPHSHTDIGYSHIQEEVEKIHTENIWATLRTIQRTKNYPTGSRYVWNIESLWAVENFMQVASAAEQQAFIEAVRSGSIALSGFYANCLTGLATPEEMRWYTEYAQILKRRYSLPVNTVMMSDIPGMNWSLVEALANAGIRYFSNGPNYMEGYPDRGDRVGHINRALGDKPIWWKSPSGKDSILLWSGGKGYSSWHGFTGETTRERGARKIASYMQELAATQYPYNMVHWRYNIVADNGPIDSTISDFVKAWNEQYESPRLVLSTVNNLFEAFESKYGKSIPVQSGDLTPYWEDGAYSTALEENNNRQTSERIAQLEAAAKLIQIALDSQLLYRAKRSVVMFHEHTWGSWNSTSDPDNPFTIHQWNFKKRFLDSAVYYTNKLEAQMAASSKSGQVQVTNTLPWQRSAYVEIPGKKISDAKSLLDGLGQTIALQKLQNGNYAALLQHIPPQQLVNLKPQPQSANAVLPKQDLTYANHQETGSIHQLSFGGRQWVDANSPYAGIGQAVYVRGLDPKDYYLSKANKTADVDKGIVVNSTRIDATLEGTNSVTYQICQVNGTNDMRLSVTIDKKAIRSKESVHIAFPFAITNARVRMGIGDTCYSSEQGQLYGSNKDFFSVQRWIDISNSDFGVTISCPQGALWEIGEMVDERQLNGSSKIWKD